VQQIRFSWPRVRREHRWHGVLPPGRQVPDVVRAKALARAGDRADERTPRRSCSPAARRQVHRAQPPPGRLRPDRPVAGLLLEGIVLRLRADLRWLEACERKWAGRRSVS
jgi:hypothetical protein